MVIEPHLINELWRRVCLKMEHAPKIVFQMGNIDQTPDFFDTHCSDKPVYYSCRKYRYLSTG